MAERAELLTSCAVTESSLAKPNRGLKALYCERIGARTAEMERREWPTIAVRTRCELEACRATGGSCG